MKRKLRGLWIALIVSALFCAALGLTACGSSVTLKNLRIEGARTDFKIGDEFEYGENFKVYACYSDGHEEDVTEEAEFRFEASYDKDVPGNYQITVRWGGKSEIYTIYIGDFENILRKIEINATAAKKEFDLGDEVSLQGLKVRCTYENAQGNMVYTDTEDLKAFDVSVVNESGHAVEDVFDRLGTYTVTLSIGTVKGSYTVDVKNVNISTVQGAIAAGSAFQYKVESGTHHVEFAQNSTQGLDRPKLNYLYEFGVDHTHVKETMEPNGDEYYASVEDGKFFGVHLQNGKIVIDNVISPGLLDGSPFDLYYANVRVFGVENMIASLYRDAKRATNQDLTESADEATRTYSFSFSGLRQAGAKDDYFETTVSFTLAEDYSVASANYVQDNWQNNEGNAVGNPPTFITDANGITTPGVGTNGQPLRWSYHEVATVTQVTGERTKTNPYSVEATKVKSYGIRYNDTLYEEDDFAIDCAMGTTASSVKVMLYIEDLQPATSSFALDPLYLDYDGNTEGKKHASTFLGCSWFNGVVWTNKILSFNVLHGGVLRLRLITDKTYKTITLNITGNNPTSMRACLGNPANGTFASGTTKTLAIGGSVYFKGEVNQYANEAQLATVTSSNASDAVIEETVIGNGNKCFRFTAKAAGLYTVTVSSAVAPSIQCTFTFKVNEMPDYEAVLCGTYTTQDFAGNTFTVVFTPQNSDDGINGTVAVTVTPAEDSVDYTKTTTVTLDYRVDMENFSIVLTGNNTLGVDLGFNAQNELTLEDKGGRTFILSAI